MSPLGYPFPGTYGNVEIYDMLCPSMLDHLLPHGYLPLWCEEVNILDFVSTDLAFHDGNGSYDRRSLLNILMGFLY